MGKTKGKGVSLVQTSGQASKFTTLEREVMTRKLELETGESIMRNLGITQHTYYKIINGAAFQREYLEQCNSADRTIRARAESLSGEALDTVRDIMRDAVTPAYRLRAALEILDRAGYVKVEKRVNLTYDAEAVIKALNQQGAQPAGDEPLDAQVVSSEPSDEFTEIVESVDEKTNLQTRGPAGD